MKRVNVNVNATAPSDEVRRMDPMVATTAIGEINPKRGMRRAFPFGLSCLRLLRRAALGRSLERTSS